MVCKRVAEGRPRAWEEGRRLKSTKQTERELLRNAPSWVVELTRIADDVQKSLPGLARPSSAVEKRALQLQ